LSPCLDFQLHFSLRYNDQNIFISNVLPFPMKDKNHHDHETNFSSKVKMSPQFIQLGSWNLQLSRNDWSNPQ
jgi:hypothetical protein